MWPAPWCSLPVTTHTGCTQSASSPALHSAGPIPASSGKTTRHRLNPGSDRQANAVLWRIALVRLAVDPITKAYLYKRFFQGITKIEAVGCLKLYIAREIFNALPQTAPA